MQDYHPFQNISILNETSLVFSDDLLGHLNKPIIKDFRAPFVVHVEEANREVLLNVVSLLDLGHQGNHPIIQSFDV